MEDMTRAELEALGLTKEQIDSIMGINGNDIEKVKTKLTDAEKEAETLKEQIKDRDKQLNDLKNSKEDLEGLKSQIETLQKDNKAKDEQYKAEIRNLKVNSAVEAALTGAKAKNLTAVKALLKDLDKAELLEDGTVKGLKEQIEALTKADDSKFLFDIEAVPQTPKGATPASSPKATATGITREQFNKMGYRDRLELFNNDPTTYNSLMGEN
nr:MAG TPA: minor structural protein [Caudoviricetes sp.]